MAKLQRVTKDELICNVLALYYGTSVAEVLRIANQVADEKKKEKMPVRNENNPTDEKDPAK